MGSTTRARTGARQAQGRATATATEHGTPTAAATRMVASVRIALSGVFLWAFFDKTFGLGYATARENAWINGGSPTTGFLTFATQGPFAEAFQALAGNALVDVLFMVGLLGIGAALLLGIGLRVAGVAGALMMLLMWAAALPPANNPVLDDHIVYALVLLALPLLHAGDTWGLGRRWAQMRFVEEHRWLV